MRQRFSEAESEEKAHVRFFKSDSSGFVELGVNGEYCLFIGRDVKVVLQHVRCN